MGLLTKNFRVLNPPAAAEVYRVPGVAGLIQTDIFPNEPAVIEQTGMMTTDSSAITELRANKGDSSVGVRVSVDTQGCGTYADCYKKEAEIGERFWSNQYGKVRLYRIVWQQMSNGVS